MGEIAVEPAPTAGAHTGLPGAQPQSLRVVACRSVDEGRLEVSFPLRRGRWSIPGPYGRDLRLEVAPDARLNLLLQLDSATGRLRITIAKIRFTPSLRVLNPSRSLKDAQGLLARVRGELEDLVADMLLDELYFNEAGALSASGHLEILHFLRSTLPFDNDVHLELDVERLLDGNGAAARAAPDANGHSTSSGSFDLRDFLVRLGAVLSPGTLQLSGSSQPIPIRIPQVEIDGNPTVLTASLAGRVALTSAGAIELDIERRDQPALACALAALHLWGGLRAGIDGSGAWTLDATPSLAVALGDAALTLKPKDSIAIPLSVRRADNHVEGSGRVHADARGVSMPPDKLSLGLRVGVAADEPIRIAKLQAKLGDGVVALAGQGQLSVKDGGVELDEADARATITVSDVEFGYGPFRGKLDTQLTLGLNANDAWFRSKTLSGGGAFALRVGLDPGAGGILSHLPKIDRELKFEIFPEGGVELGSSFGLLEALLDPLFELSGKAVAIVPVGGPAAGPPGSAPLVARLAELAAAPARAGQQINLLVDGSESFARRRELIAAAKRSVCLQTPVFADDRAGRTIAAALGEAVGRGCKVRVIVDALANLSSLSELTAGNPIYRMLRDAGVDLRLYNDPVAAQLGATLEDVSIVPELAGDSFADLRALSNPLTAVRVFHHLVQVATGRSPVQPDVRQRVTAALRRLLQTTSGYSRRGAAAELDLPDGDGSFGLHDLLFAARQVAGLNHRWHGKLLVVDEEVALIGSSDIAVPSADPGAYEADLYVRGSSVADVYAGFAAAWKVLGGEELAAIAPHSAASIGNGWQPADVQVVWHRPREEGDHHILNLTIEVLRALGAGDRAWIASPHFLPIGPLSHYKEALAAAARRGVDVRILTNSEKTSELPDVNRAAVFVYRELLAAGARIFERADARMHARAATFAGKMAIVGSWNVDNRSESLCSEVVAVVHGDAPTRQLDDMFMAATAPAAATEITAQSLARRPLRTELRSLAASAVGELL